MEGCLRFMIAQNAWFLNSLYVCCLVGFSGKNISCYLPQHQLETHTNFCIPYRVSLAKVIQITCKLQLTKFFFFCQNSNYIKIGLIVFSFLSLNFNIFVKLVISSIIVNKVATKYSQATLYHVYEL